MLKNWQLWREKKRLSDFYFPRIQEEINIEKKEELRREYRSQLDEILSQQRLHEDQKLLKKALRKGLYVPMEIDETGNSTAWFEREWADQVFVKRERAFELAQKIKEEQRKSRFELIQGASTIGNLIGKFVVVPVFLLFSSVYDSSSNSNDTRLPNKTDQVEISVRYDRGKCLVPVELRGITPDQYFTRTLDAERKVLAISIRNKSRRVIAKVRWSLSVHREGHSTDLTDYQDLSPLEQPAFKRSNTYVNDKILQPGEVVEDCYMLPMTVGGYAPENLRYAVKSKTVDFVE